MKIFDTEIAELLELEKKRQDDCIRLIPSENYTSKNVLALTGSILSNKYSEGYPGKRYYQGQKYIDKIETIAIERAKKLFNAEAANVQPYSGSPANLEVYFAFLNPNDKIMGLNLNHGGHLTHGWKVSITGKYFQSVQYEVDPETKTLDYNKIRDIAKKEKPNIIIAGGTAYPRIWDFKKFRDIADESGAILVTDMAHIAGLVAADVHPSPIPYSDVVTTTTHKTLRGPRGGMILCKEKHIKAINRAVFPGCQGGPHNNTTAAIAVALKEAMTDEFKKYAQQIVKNAKVFAAELLNYGFDVVTGGTDNHLLLVDLSNMNITGKQAAVLLEECNIICNYNTVPFDRRSPFDPSGIRLGTPAVTTRNMKEPEIKYIAESINKIIKNPDNASLRKEIKKSIIELCHEFPVTI